MRALPEKNKNPSFDYDWLARLAVEATQEEGLSATPGALKKRIKRLQVGLPAEDEFVAILTWLGKCTLIHRLDQMQMPPTSWNRYYIPDLLVVFNYENREIPVLIEVKTGKKQSLSLKAQQVEGMRRYAELLQLPLLIAWKFSSMRVWSLFELDHLSHAVKNYNISFNIAQQQNLMGLLAGDFLFKLRAGAGVHFVYKKLKKIREARCGEGRSEAWHVVLEKAYFSNGDGSPVETVGPELGYLILTSETEEYARVDEAHIYDGLRVPESEPFNWAHRVLETLLKWPLYEQQVSWRKILREGRLPIECSKMRESAQKGIPEKIVRFIFDILPHKRPLFLSD